MVGQDKVIIDMYKYRRPVNSRAKISEHFFLNKTEIRLFEAIAIENKDIKCPPITLMEEHGGK